MIFREMVHWSDGLFLQPHHMQQLQNSMIDVQQKSFMLSTFYTYGLIDFKIDEEALEGMRFVVKKLSAVMPNNLSVSMPGNLNITPFTFEPTEYINDEHIMVYLAIPHYKDTDANLSYNDNERVYSTKEMFIRDENTGDNEISMLKRIYNGKITTNTLNEDYNYLPLCRLRWVSKNINEPKLDIDSNYTAPFYIITDDCPLKSYISELMYVVKKKCEHIIKELSENGYNTNNLAGGNLFNVMQLSTLSSFEKVISSLIVTNKVSPFVIYLNLTAMLSQLTALQPFTNRDDVMAYSHDNLMEVYKDVVTNIRSIIMAGGYTDYVQYEFQLNGDYYKLQLNSNDIIKASNCYLAISISGNTDIAKEYIEQGDNFRLINEQGIEKRIRGVKLKELRFPPRYLPVIPNAVWFSLEDMAESEAWNLICREKTAAIELLPESFPDFHGSLFITFEQGENNDNSK